MKLKFAFHRVLNIYTILVLVVVLQGCMASKKNHVERIILQGIDSAAIDTYQLPENVIKAGDLLTIMVFSDNIEATELFNQPQGSSASGMASTSQALSSMGRGYLVDKNGEIYFQSLGRIKVQGWTKSQLSKYLSDNLATVLKNPYINIRFTNARITVLGEVMRPGVIEIPDQKVSILDAIGFAGDLTAFGRRDKVLVIREIDGKRTHAFINMKDADLYKSPFFYLQQNDLVYVEPTRRKPTGNEQVLMRNVTIGTSIVSVIALLATLIAK